jgi:Transglutaminase-like superfamily
MRFLKLQAYRGLIQFDVYLAKNFSALHEEIRSCRVRSVQRPEDIVQKVCAAVDIACTWYWKDVLCLQRSATTTSMLRQHGVHAELVIGIQQLPFRSHAWVEVDGRVVNDKEYVRETYLVLDRC